ESYTTLIIVGVVLLVIALAAMQYHTSRAHHLQTEVPREIAAAHDRLRALKDSAAQAAIDLEALRAEAPPEVWSGHQATVAHSAATLQDLRDKLNAIEAQRREEYRELRSAHRGLREWSRTHEKSSDAFTAIGTTLQQFRESQDQVVAGIPQIAETLHRVSGEIGSMEPDERTKKLLQAAQETFDRARELRRDPPVNWLLLRDLLEDVQDCLTRLDCLVRTDSDPKQKRSAMIAKRGARYWSESAQCSPANQELILQMEYWSWHAGSAGADGGAVDTFSGFGGGDTGSGGEARER